MKKLFKGTLNEVLNLTNKICTRRNYDIYTVKIRSQIIHQFRGTIGRENGLFTVKLQICMTIVLRIGNGISIITYRQHRILILSNWFLEIKCRIRDKSGIYNLKEQ